MVLVWEMAVRYNSNYYRDLYSFIMDVHFESHVCANGLAAKMQSEDEIQRLNE